MTSSKNTKVASPFAVIPANAKVFKYRGKQITITLTAPDISPDEFGLHPNANVFWGTDIDVTKLTDLVEVRGHYVPATYAIDGFGYSITMTTGLDAGVGGHNNAIVITEMKMTGNNTQKEMVLPLERLRVYALQLAGVFGTAFPPNYRQYFGTRPRYFDGSNEPHIFGWSDDTEGESDYMWFDSGPEGVIYIDRYGYRMTRTDALEMLGEHDRPKRLTRHEILVQVARLHMQLQHHGKYQYIADELGISYSMAKTLVAECRKPSVDLLPATGRTRTKPKPQARKRGKK